MQLQQTKIWILNHEFFNSLAVSISGQEFVTTHRTLNPSASHPISQVKEIICNFGRKTCNLNRFVVLNHQYFQLPNPEITSLRQFSGQEFATTHKTLNPTSVWHPLPLSQRMKLQLWQQELQLWHFLMFPKPSVLQLPDLPLNFLAVSISGQEFATTNKPSTLNPTVSNPIPLTQRMFLQPWQN